MCGIAGAFAYASTTPAVDDGELLRMRERMIARGPDGAGLWISSDRRVGLAHRRLSIIDLSQAGAQPMSTPDGRLRIVFNGEIYNYRELRKELQSSGAVFRSESDTEVLLQLYAKDGEAMLGRLRGMFAFAIWDALDQKLFLARDSFGIKPLYIADDGRVLRFASQVKALLAGGRIDTTADPAGHVGFFLWGHVPEPFTLYKSIRALPAGTWVSKDGNGRRVERRFFDLTAELAKPEVPAISTEEGRRVLREALMDSVRAHLVADVPVGVFLSAGLDSTTVAALAAEQGQSTLRTFTLGFREFAETTDDESPLASQVAKHISASHQTSYFGREDFAGEFDRFMASMDQPSIDGVNTYFVSKAAHQGGLKVALSGLGGDELFAGYSDFRDIPRLVHSLRPFAWMRGIGKAFRYVSAPVIQRFTSPKYAGLLEYGGEWTGAYLLRRGLFMPWELPEVLNPDLVREGWQRLQTSAALQQTIFNIAPDRLKVAALETGWYMRNQLLRDTDWASMAHSLEVRVPLVDRELFCTVALLAHGGFMSTKLDMGGTPTRPVPDAVLTRPKTGFSVPVREWLLPSVSTQPRAARRGLRGWARIVYGRLAANLVQQAQPAEGFVR